MTTGMKPYFVGLEGGQQVACSTQAEGPRERENDGVTTVKALPRQRGPETMRSERMRSQTMGSEAMSRVSSEWVVGVNVGVHRRHGERR